VTKNLGGGFSLLPPCVTTLEERVDMPNIHKDIVAGLFYMLNKMTAPKFWLVAVGK